MLDDAERFPIGHIVARAAEPVEWDQINPGDDGIRRTRISVLFGNFDRHGAATRLERIVERQEHEIRELRIVIQEQRRQLEDLRWRLEAVESRTRPPASAAR
jgi:hypothetical protein